jgi:hypothetical protein
MQDKKQKKIKKIYLKPEIRVIDLAADEVLAVGCKTPTGPGKAQAVCLTPAPCTGPGS